MKITKSLLKRLIKEELGNVLGGEVDAQGGLGPPAKFAMAVTDKLKALGWNISSATKLYNGSNGGTMAPEEIADLADTIQRSEGEEAVVMQIGLTPYPPPGY